MICEVSGKRSPEVIDSELGGSITDSPGETI